MTAQSETPRRGVVHILQEFSIPLIAGVVAAVVWANLAPESYHHMLEWSPFGEGSHLNFHFVVNDLFMVLFFALAAKEITEACLPGGALNPPRKAINPILGTIGGVVGPVGAYLAYAHFAGAPEIARGWGIPTATDIALGWLVARIAFGKGHPAVSFLLLLAVVDDGIGLGIIAIFYPDPHHPVRPEFLALVGVSIAMAWGLRRAGVGSYWPYLLVPGVVSWAGLMLAHLHPALALVPIVPFMPSAPRDWGLYAEESDGRAHPDTLNRFEHAFKMPVDFALFGFGLANAGVAIGGMGHATWAVLMGLIVGKTLGIFVFSGIGHRLGFPLPDGVNLRCLLVVSLTAGLGLTVALFVSGVAFTDPTLQSAAKMGALLSAGVAPLAILLARMLRVRGEEPRRETRAPMPSMGGAVGGA